jgi:hypothetical protein
MMTYIFQTVIKTVEKTADNGIELINKVDSFYNSAWDKLILVGTVAFGVIGILVPFVIQWYQKKSLKISEELMKKELENQTLKLKSELLDDINKILEERIKTFEEKIEKLNASTNAKTFHLQGNGQLNSGDFSGALSDYITCAQDYLFCEDFSNLQTVLRLILNDCLPSLSHEEINDLKISHNSDLTTLLDNLTEKEDKGTFSQIIRETKLKLSKLPKTIKEKPQPET